MADRLTELVAELVAIDSVNPALVPGGAGESEIAAFVASWARGAGVPTVMFGPSGAGAHELEEWVSLPDTEAVARILVAVAQRVCA